MVDLTTSYMGLSLKNPIIVSSSDLTRDLEGVKKCAEAGAGAVVLKSIFEEQFILESDIPLEDYTAYPEALDYMRSGGLLEYAPRRMVEMIRQAKQEVDIPIIASINCQTTKLWTRFARQLQDAGADALELNLYTLPLNPDVSSSEIEEGHLKVLKKVKQDISIPVSMKLASEFTSLAYLSKRLADHGCDALVFFNWFLEPDIDIKSMKTKNRIGKGNFYQVLKWIALISGRVDCMLAASGGIEQGRDVVKQILAGASAAQVCTLFYKKGLGEIRNLLREIEAWMEERGYSGLDDFRGELSFKQQELIKRDLGEAGSYMRSQYLKTISHLNGA